jgi:hypothetical protein
MDIGRWGLEKVSKLTDRYRDFHQFLGDVLEGVPLPNFSSAGAPVPQREPSFSAQNDIEKILDLPQLRKQKGRSPKLEAIFKSLVPYFEAGFLIQTIAAGAQSPQRTSTQDSTSVLRSMFLFGHAFSPSDSGEMPVSLALPSFQKELVVRGRVMPVLKTFELETFKTLHDASTFAFSPSPGFVILLICNRPHPWQVDMIERTYLTVMETLK